MVALRNGLIGIFLFTLVGVGVGYWLLQKSLQQPLVIEHSLEPQLIEIQSGSHLRSVLALLAERGHLTGSVDQAYYALRIFTQTDSIQAGVYAITPDATLADFWQQVSAGEGHLFQLTLVEGQTWKQWVTLLQQAPYLRTELTDLSEAEVLQRLGLTDFQRMEGLLLPETYTYKAYTRDTVILRKAAQAMAQVLDEIWSERDRDLPYSSPYELLTMASIIEKETGVRAERARVSSVFVNRLRLGMRLQSDPTTIYGIDNFNGDLTRADLRADTAYNTYRIDALPPTPIAMISRASLHAAAHPESSDYLYFVADGSGGHVFSKNLQDHNRAVNRYQRGIRNP